MLILSNELDVSVDWVVRLLRGRHVDYLRLNTERAEDFDWRVEPSLGQAVLSTRDQKFDLSSVSGVWFRRPETPNPSWNGMHRSELEFAKAQWRAIFLGLRSIGSASWINDPFRNLEAESKLLQIRAAKEVGLPMPETLVTNSREEALSFLRTLHGEAVIKALHAPLVEREDALPQFIFTEKATLEMLRSAFEREPIPFILQRYITPKTDLRVTVVDDRIFTAAIVDSRPALDWRRLSPPARFAPAELPGAVGDWCRDLVRRLQLRFGAIDLIESEGEYFFLEINPNGEWGWLQKTCELPIAEALADALTGGIG